MWVAACLRTHAVHNDELCCLLLRVGACGCLQCLPVFCRGPQRVFRLPDLWVRPGLGGKGRKMPGALEAHHNGFR